MPRPTIGESLANNLREYLAIAEEHPPDERPLNVSQVATALNVGRSSIYKYGLQTEIEEAAKRQRRNARISGGEREKDALRWRMRKFRAELQKANNRNKALLERLSLYEAFIAQKGWDPEEALADVRDVKPDRVVPASRGKGSGRFRRVK